MFATALCSLDKPDYRNAVWFCLVIADLYQFLTIHYSIHCRQCPLTALHTGHCSGCSLALTASWHILPGPNWAAQIQSGWILAPLRGFWDQVMFSQVLPASQLHIPFSFFLADFSILQSQAMPGDFGCTCNPLNGCVYFTFVASRWDCSNGPGVVDSSVSNSCPKGVHQRCRLLHLNRAFILTWNLQDYHDDRLRCFWRIFLDFFFFLHHWFTFLSHIYIYLTMWHPAKCLEARGC